VEQAWKAVVRSEMFIYLVLFVKKTVEIQK